MPCGDSRHMPRVRALHSEDVETGDRSSEQRPEASCGEPGSSWYLDSSPGDDAHEKVGNEASHRHHQTLHDDEAGE